MDAKNSGHTPSLEMAYVLFMDIVAYSTLRMDEQQSVLSKFLEAVRTTTEFTRARAEDQLIRLPTGDGMALVFFGDPEAPARCALELSRNLREHPEVKLRMGIHSGPVCRVADINANRNFQPRHSRRQRPPGSGIRLRLRIRPWVLSATELLPGPVHAGLSIRPAEAASPAQCGYGHECRSLT